MRRLLSALSAVALALAAPGTRGEAALPCAAPATNPEMPAEMASDTLRSYQERAGALPAIALPRQAIATRELDLVVAPAAVAAGAPGQLRALADDAASGRFNRIACAEVAERSATILCLFKDVVVGNLAFYRAASWIEGTRAVAPRQFVAGYAAYADVLAPPARYVDGFDLQWRDLEAYRDAAVAACPHDPASCLNRTEAQLFEHLLVPLALQRGDFVILAAGYGKPDIVGHELLHAQYFLFPKYRAVIDCYFERELTDAARAEVLADLEGEYDVANRFLVRNEFQAYLLQPGDLASAAPAGGIAPGTARHPARSRRFSGRAEPQMSRPGGSAEWT